MKTGLRRIFIAFGVGILVMSFAANGYPGAEDLAKERSGLAPESGVVIEIHRKWMWRHWAGAMRTKTFSLNTEDAFPEFTVGEPGLRAVWTYYLDLPVDFNRYPIAVLKYRARNTHTKSGNYVIWLDDGTGPDFGGLVVFRSKELIPDGEIHELRKDLRAFNPKEPISCIALGVMCGDKAPAAFGLVGIHFETAPDAPLKEPWQEDAPLNVLVTNPQGESVEGAKVIVDAERKNFARSAFTDKNGLCRITPLKNETEKHMLRVEMEGMVAVERSNLQQITKRPVHIVIRRGRRCSGVVKDEEDNPVKGATVSLLVSLNKREKDTRAENRFVDILTDEKGCWQSPLLIADADRISVKLGHPDFVTDPSYKRHLDIEKFRKEEPITLIVKKGIRLSGKVSNENGDPLSGAKIVIGHSTCGVRPPITKSDANGHFEFKSLPAGETIITIQRGKYAAELQKIMLSEEKEMNFVLKKGKVLFGKIVNEKGEPIPKARIGSDAWRGHRTLSLSQRTNEKGEFRFDNAPEGTIDFDIWASGYADKRDFPLVARDKPYEIILSKPLKISGKVIDANTGKPIPKFGILTGSVLSEGGKAYWDEGNERAKEFENPGGNFEVTRTYPQKGYKVRALADDYAFTEYPQIFKMGEEVKDIVIALKRGLQLKGRVYSSGKKPLKGVKAVLAGEDAHIQVDGINIGYSRGSFKETYTDEKGKFTFDGLGEESYQLLLIHPEKGGKFVPGITSSKQIQKIELEPYAGLEGRAYEYDKPLSGCEIALSPASPLIHFGRQPFYFHSRTKTDRDGKWSFDKLLPGGYSASIMVLFPHGPGFRSYNKSRQGVALKPGERKFIILGGAGGPALRGRVTGPEGKPVAGAQVSLSSVPYGNSYYIDTRADGTYKITELKPGRYNVHFSLYEREDAGCCGRGKLVMEKRKKVLIKPDYPEVKLDVILEEVQSREGGK